LGAQVGETSLLSSAGRILGVLLGDLSYHEGSFGNLLLSYDLTPKPLQFYKHGIGPVIEVYKQSGLGIDVDPLLLNKMTLAMAA
jgi:hypothetical protein